MREFARRHLGRIDLLQYHASGIDLLPQIDAQPVHAIEQDVRTLVEQEHSGNFSALGSRCHEFSGDRRFACASRPDHERAAACLDTAAE